MTCDRSVVFFGYFLVSSTDKTDRHDITEILLKVALNTISQTKPKPNQLTTYIYCTVYVYVIIHFCDACSPLCGSESVLFFLNRLFIVVGDSITKRGGVLFYAFPSQDMDFHHHMSWSFLCLMR